MKTTLSPQNRRNFLKTSACLTTGIFGMVGLPQWVEAKEGAYKEGLYVIGPMEGYTPQIGILVSMLNYNRHTIIDMVKEFVQKLVKNNWPLLKTHIHLLLLLDQFKLGQRGYSVFI